ncbi:MAG: tripartite tricarboxylate transporter substrate binding protein [Proteobacteria bacterium]|nr:tripartite tricarboxylate transporter substrate binding protein [Burkholderiales bacterium]
MKRLGAALLATLCVAASTAFAQDWPSKPIRILVPNPPGGVTDLLTRLVAPRMSDALGQPIVIENLPGAGGVPGTNQAARANPDGHTLAAVFDSFATNPYLYNNVQYDPVKDFAPIALMARQPQVLVVNTKVAAKTVADLARVAKASGGMTFAVPGLATSSRFSTELLKTTLGIDITVVPYKGGAAAITEVMGGQVQAMIASIGLVLPHIQAGRLVPIGVSSLKRTPQLPNVPTIADTFPGFEAQSWSGMLAPAKTPRPVIDRLNAVLVKALAAPDVREKMEALGTELVGGTPEQFGDWLKGETQRWGRIIREQKITLE